METVRMLGAIVGIVLLALGIVNTVLMCEVLGRKGAPNSYRLIHRWLGRIFVVAALGTFIYMFPRAAHLGQFPPHAVFHAFAGLALVPLVIAKYLVAARYRSFSVTMLGLGFAILTCLFIAIMLASGHAVAEKIFG